jgi:3-hydroxyisobutyrate dehydrogenase
MNKTKLPILGFIGLGVMGTPMAGHLAQHGYSVIGFDLNPELGRGLAAAFPTVKAQTDLKQLAKDADIVITMLPNGEVVQRVVFDIVEQLRPGALVLDTSSCEPWLTQQTAAALAKRGVAMVDAPVSGAQWGAQAAELVFMLGGETSDIARVQPLLDIMGRASFHLGPLGSGHAMKCINNTITSMNFLATLEGLAMGTKFGLDPKVMNAVLNESTGMSWVTKNHIDQRVTSRTFDDPFKLELMVKDIGIAMRVARELNAPMPMAGLGQQLWLAALNQAAPQASISEVARWVERFVDVPIASKLDNI